MAGRKIAVGHRTHDTENEIFLDTTPTVRSLVVETILISIPGDIGTCNDKDTPPEWKSKSSQLQVNVL